MTVYAYHDGALRAYELPERIACLHRGACFKRRKCGECGLYRPSNRDIDETKALFAEIDAFAKATAYSGPINENHVRGWKESCGLVRPRVLIGMNAPDYGGRADKIPEPRLLQEGWK